MAIGISLHIQPDTQTEAIQVVEALSRVATGLAFEGLSVNINIITYEPEEDDLE